MDEIAIVGMAGRFPGADDVNAFWENLRLGVESVRRFGADEMERGGPGPGERADPRYVPARGVVDGIEDFDARFFGFTPREAQLSDPQHRLLLEVAWEALEHAGIRARGYEGAIGVFAGAGGPAYLLHNLAPAGWLSSTAEAFQASIHNKADHLATRIAYKLDLRGPAMTVQTACSTSLVAVAAACQALADFQCDAALAGGSNIAVPQRSGYLYHEHGIGSPDGHCRAFDAQAQGTVPGNGAGMVVLKRLEDALAAGDTVHAVVRGWAINNDGGGKVGYTAPAVEGQASVIAGAQALAGVPPESITFVEAHGTGTSLGDPIEVRALTQAFRRGTARNGFCALGSVKTNIGHLDAAAGVAGLIKAVQALVHREIPPTLHYTRANPAIDFESTPFYVASALQPWTADGAPRRAGVSSFGLGGTNAHVVLEEAPEPPAPAPARPLQLLLLSAEAEGALEESTRRLAAHLRAHADVRLADVAWTLQTGREAFAHRRMLVCSDRDDALAALESLAPERVLTRAQKPARRSVFYLFPGQGTQHAGMARELYGTEPVFRAEVDRLLELAAPFVADDLRALLLAPRGTEEADAALRRTASAQPALFIVEYALAQLWRSWGVEPAGMLGHSIGEYTAACLAGVMTPADALRLVAARGALMQDVPGGSMLSVPLPEAEVLGLLGDDLSLAAVNGPELCVVSGPTPAVDRLRAELDARGVAARPLHTSHAFHSRMMDPVLEAFRAEVERTPLSAPRLPYLSNLSGRWITPAQATDPGYWVEHLRRTVRFADAVEVLLEDPEAVLLEVGPGRALRTMARWHPRKLPGQVMLASLPNPREEAGDYASMLHAVGQLWLAGVEPRWEVLHGAPRRRVPLPTYPFQRKRHWVDAPLEGARTAPVRGADGGRADPSEWFYVPVWRESAAAMPVPGAAALAAAGPWLVLADDGGLGARVVWKLRTAGARVVQVKPGAGFAALGGGDYTVSPESADDWRRMMEELPGERRPCHVLHMWGASPAADDGGDGGLQALMVLVRALGAGAALELAVVTAGAHEVSGGDLERPEQATLAGALPVIAREYPSLTCRGIDVALPRADFEAARLVDRLLWEVAKCDEPGVAYRGGRRWLPGFEPVRLKAAAGPPGLLRHGGVYLVTGGLGGIGLEVAAWLGRTVQARLVLTGRSAFPDRAEWDAHAGPARRTIERLRAIEASGGQVMVHQADAADLEGMRAVVAAAESRFGAVHGVVHAAGVAGGGLVRTRSADEVRAVLAPKLGGARVIEALFPEPGLDFVVLFSSRTVLAGRPGQADYAAANAFLDAFAHRYRARTGTHTVSVAWPGWEKVGMAARARAGATAAPVRIVGHPLLDACLRENGAGALFTTTMSPERRWVVDEHRIAGHAVVPGVAYVEMVRAAVGGGRERPVRLDDVFFLNPLRVRDGDELEQRLELEREGDGFRFAVWTGEGTSRRENALGRVTVGEPRTPPRQDLDAIRARCGEERADAREDDREDDLGPRWRSIKGLRLGHQEMLLELELPSAFESDFEQMVFHPALLDRTQGIAKNFLAGAGYWLPYGYRRVEIHAPMQRHVFGWSRFHGHGTDGETITFDFAVMDPSGRVLLEVEGFVQKRMKDPGAELRALAEEDAAPAPEPVAASGGGIQPQEGVDALCRILAARLEPQVVVSPEDLEAWRAGAGDTSAEALAAALADPADGTRAALPEGAGVEERLAQVWQDVLGIESIAHDDNYFELGGDSVQAIQIIHQARRYGLHLTPEQFFRHETVAELAQAVRAAGGADDGAPPSGEPAAPVEPAPFAPPAIAQGEMALLSALLRRADEGGAAVAADEPEEVAS
jgi:acyl transferase domain-containing protein